MSRAPTNWDERYAQEGWAFGTLPNDFLKAEHHWIPQGRVLCLGEGEGRNATFLAQKGYRVTALDQSRVGLQKARTLARSRGVTLDTVVASVEDHDLGVGEWRGIVSIFFHLFPELRRPLHRRVVEALAPGGVLLLEAYTPRQLELGTGGPPHAERLLTLDVLREELDGLHFVLARETLREIHEGRLHNGWGSVVQVVAVKG